MKSNIETVLPDTVEKLSAPENLAGLSHQVKGSAPLPSSDALREMMEMVRGILFPGFFGRQKIRQETLKYRIGVEIENFFRILKKQVIAGLCYEGCNAATDEIRQKSIDISESIVSKLPELRSLLKTDVEAAFNGDPAATSFSEIICCYPVIRTLVNYRLAHELHVLGVPLIPRMITELAHSETGIDIHPAAEIGHHFTIDHGTGVVIGATCIIGNNVKLYQGVTLGALSFPLDENGNPIKGIPRHPILQDDVIVYSNATILGRITIGKGSVIGANKWVTESVAPGSKIYKNVKILKGFEDGTGI